MTLSFGTDGVRGRAHEELTTADVALLAQAAAEVLAPAAFVIGADSRESGPAFVDALTAGFAARAVPSWVIGVAPTPAVAHLAAAHDVAGAMVSASHNPFHDNGIKFFAPGGRKLTDEAQEAIQEAYDSLAAAAASPAPAPATSVQERHELVASWTDLVGASLDGRRLDGLRVVIDCANGAASGVAEPVLRSLGADVTAIHCTPDGRNINNSCGSTHPEDLQAAVVAAGADLGLAFDGDADRLLAIDADGTLVDGDHIIAICAIDLHQRQLLTDHTVVVTVMTNLGFRLAMAERGIHVEVTPVGDRHVLETLERTGTSLGGEQSGHLIFHDIAGTGDGLLSAVLLADVVVRSGRPLAELAAASMTRLPQVLENLRIEGDAKALTIELADDIAAVEAELGERGRVLVRPSGTEPLLRVMVEAPTEELARNAVDKLLEAARDRTS